MRNKYEHQNHFAAEQSGSASCAAMFTDNGAIRTAIMYMMAVILFIAGFSYVSLIHDFIFILPGIIAILIVKGKLNEAGRTK